MQASPQQQHLFWSKNVEQLDVVRDRPYIIHQALAFGTLDDLKWLHGVYPPAIIRQTFVEDPIKIYTRSAYHFAKRMLNVSDQEAPVARYDKTLPRYIG